MSGDAPETPEPEQPSPTIVTAVEEAPARGRRPRQTEAFAATAVFADATVDAAELTVDSTEKTGSSEAVELPAGTVLSSRYVLTELVGQGGMGAVYAARDEDLDEEIAIKVLRPDLVTDLEFQRRLRGEVRLARRVSHPNVCRVHDLGVSEQILFVTMELVRGATLRGQLAEMRSGRLPPLDLAQIVDLVQQIGSALSAAHRAGVIHRDVKPDNVIVDGSRAVLTDFGVASTMLDANARVLAGTPLYIAPEVLRHEPFDFRVDVYALACVTYELVAGRPPYPAARTVEIATRMANDRPPYPGLPDAFATPAIREALDRVLSRALLSDPAVRTASVERFTDALAHAARGAPLTQAVQGLVPTTGDSRMVTTPQTLTRRSEVRVATALVWHGTTPRDMEMAERVVVDAGGTPVRVTTDSISALFGVSRSLGDDADRAALAALALIGKLGGGAAIDTTRILLRPGVSDLAGPDTLASVTELAELAFDRVVTSPETARQLAARFVIAVVEEAPNAAGRLRHIVGVRPIDEPVPVESFRATELAAIDAHLETAFRERIPIVVAVRGAPGSGKTRLRKAVMTAVSERREVEWLVAIASPAGEPAPLAAIRSCSRDWYDATTGNDTIVEPTKREVAARRWLEARATRRPVVIVIEDVQWIDPSSKALLDHLRLALADVPVAIVTFGRSLDARSEPVAHGVEVVELGSLDREAATRFARALAPAASPTVIADIVERAAGNPFFLEELSHAHATGGGLPTSIEAVIQSRLDQLPDAANHLALAAAVIGHSFWRRAVARLLPTIDDTDLDLALAELQHAGIVIAAPRDLVEDDRYQFVQTLVHDVTYARSPSRERRQRHTTVAAWLEEQLRVPGTNESQLLLALAHHHELAGDNAHAADAYRKAGSRCLALFAYGEATPALRKAAALRGKPDPTLDEELADATLHTDGHAAAEPIYQRALDETDDDDAPARARLWYKLGYAAAKRAVSQSAIARFRAGLAIAAPGGNPAPWAESDPRTLSLLLGGLGWTLGYLLGRVDEGHGYCEHAVALLEKTQYRRDLAFALSRLGGTYMRACRFADQLRCNERNLELGIELDDLDMQLTGSVNLGVVHGLLGNIDQAVAATEAARKLASKIRSVTTEGLAASNLAGFYLEQQRFDDADRQLDDAIAIIDATGARYILCESLVFRARVAAGRDDLATARRHAERSLALARSLGNHLDAAVALRVISSIESRTGDHAAARSRIEEALALATAHDAFETLRTKAARARILAAAGAPEGGSFDELRTELHRLGAKREIAVLEQLDEVR